jgi:hypothetical protein
LGLKVQLLEQQVLGVGFVQFSRLRGYPVLQKTYLLIELLDHSPLNLGQVLALKQIANNRLIDLEGHLEVLYLAQLLPPLCVHELLLILFHRLAQLLSGVRAELVIREYERVRRLGVC